MNEFPLVGNWLDSLMTAGCDNCDDGDICTECIDCPSECDHVWKGYLGLHEEYEYCEKCGIKKE